MANPGTGIIDIHGLLVRELRANDELAAEVGGRIFARKYPDRVELPACRIDYPNVAGLAPPTLQWFTYDGQIAVHAQTHIDGQRIAGVLQTALLALEGTSHPEGVISSVDPFGVWSGFDAEWTPSRPLWIVSSLIRASGP